MPTIAQPEYDLLVANLSRPHPSSITGADPVHEAPTKTRTGFVFRCIETLGFAADHFGEGMARSLVVSALEQQFNPLPPTGLPTADITVANNTFSGSSATLHLGPFRIVSNRDYAVGAGVNATATAIGGAIDNLPGYSTVVVGPVVTVSGPRGQVGLRCDATYSGGAENFTFTYSAGSQDGVLGYGPTPAASPIDPPTILPPGLPNGVAP